MLQIILLSIFGVTALGWMLNLVGWLKPICEVLLHCGEAIGELLVELLSGLGD